MLALRTDKEPRGLLSAHGAQTDGAHRRAHQRKHCTEVPSLGSSLVCSERGLALAQVGRDCVLHLALQRPLPLQTRDLGQYLHPTQRNMCGSTSARHRHVPCQACVAVGGGGRRPLSPCVCAAPSSGSVCASCAQAAVWNTHTRSVISCESAGRGTHLLAQQRHVGRAARVCDGDHARHGVLGIHHRPLGSEHL
jgi:hypothetical protein